MLANLLLKKPALVMGILMMGLFIYDYSNRSGNKKSIFFRDAFTSWSCKPVVLKLEKTTPKGWSFVCSEENLKISIELQATAKSGAEKQLLYREMANNLMFISKVSPEENLERVPIIHLVMIGENYRIDAITSGDDLSKLKHLKDKRFINQHLQSTVNVKELSL